MYFVERARTFLSGPKPGDVSQENFERMTITLEFLLENAMGRKNTISTKRIVAHVNEHGPRPTIIKEIWQTDILGYLREHGVFIGAIIGGGGGIFMIVDVEDARAARNSYKNRIRSEELHVEMLEAAVGEAGWII